MIVRIHQLLGSTFSASLGLMKISINKKCYLCIKRCTNITFRYGNDFALVFNFDFDAIYVLVNRGVFLANNVYAPWSPDETLLLPAASVLFSYPIR